MDYTPTVLLLVAGLPLAFYLLWYGWRSRTKPGALPFVFIMALSTSWTIESALELLSTDLSTKLLWADLQYLSICFLPVACLAMALDYTGNGAWLTRRNLCGLGLIPLVSLGLMWTNAHHHLMRASEWLDTSAAHPVIGRTFGPWFWVHSVYSYLLLLTALAFLVHALLSRPPLYRKQPAVLLAGLAVPVLWNLFYLLTAGLLPTFDYTPAALRHRRVDHRLGPLPLPGLQPGPGGARHASREHERRPARARRDRQGGGPQRGSPGVDRPAGRLHPEQTDRGELAGVGSVGRTIPHRRRPGPHIPRNQRGPPGFRGEDLRVARPRELPGAPAGAPRRHRTRPPSKRAFAGRPSPTGSRDSPTGLSS